MRQKAVLLSLVPAVNFIHEKNRPLFYHAVKQTPRLGHHLFQLFFAARDRRQLYKARLGLSGNNFGDSSARGIIVKFAFFKTRINRRNFYKPVVLIVSV